MTTTLGSQCLSCTRFRSPLDSVDGRGRTCAAFAGGIPDPIWLNKSDHREPYPADGGVRFAALPGATFPEYALNLVEEKAFLEQMAAKHLQGLHDQSAHGHGAARWLTPDDAMAMRQKMLADEPWSPEQQDALNRYTGGAYGEMNGLLRDDQEMVGGLSDGERAEFAGLIRDANAGMRPTTEPVKVKRFVGGYESFGLDMSQLTREEAAEALRAMKGKTLQEPGFMSTSLAEGFGKDTWLGKFRLELDVPAGARGAYLDGDVGFEREQELLLAPGTQIELTEVLIDPPRNTVRGRVVVE